ncbi:hypothetical protein CALVIDRAFT_537777 [Calocera viscosa TUFC12733]|uniref:Uncharacterized protein n=1 Tax=Calocera viscosa (strain TUFC12733) TaxID=1330018 RepID=A0A167LL06_CALVF|nr:hypothetical protein CALVIDRAFT_537777 [Calocera viscosa TUFC12733]
MAGIRCFKYAKWLLLALILWLSLAILYLTLPPGECIDDSASFAQALWDGRSLQRVYHTEEFIPREYRLPRVRRRRYLGLKYAYDRHSGVLRIRNEDVPLFPLLSPLSSTPSETSTSTPTPQHQPQQHSKLVIPWAKLGDTDGVNPPWFRTGDAVLLYSFVSREWGRILLTVERAPPPTSPDAENEEIVLHVVPARMATQREGTEDDAVPLGMPPLASLHFLPSSEGEPPTLVRVHFPPQPQSFGTSTYFSARYALLSVLAPSAMFAMALAELAGQLVKLLLIALGIVALLWIARELWMYRHEGDAEEREDARERQTAVLRKALREVLGPLYAPPNGGRHRERAARTLSDEEERFEPKEEV